MEENIKTKEHLDYNLLGLSFADIQQINNNNIDIQQVAHQINLCKTGIPKTELDKAATINDGILLFSEQQMEQYVSVYENNKNNFTFEKFVPASGAATRMFMFLSEFLSEFKPNEETLNAYINRKKDTSLLTFIIGMEKFPFFKLVDETLNTTFPDFKSWDNDKKNYFFIKYLLDEKEFDYANKPKGILPFHDYNQKIVTPVEEHLIESILYNVSNNLSNIHFTISEEHQNGFETIVNLVKEKIEKVYQVTFKITFSYQHKSTNSIAVTQNNEILRQNNKLVFRPSGHGALIKNLYELDSDIIFIKNIDNITHKNLDQIAYHKKILTGYLINIQKKVFHYLNILEKDLIIEDDYTEIKYFINDYLNIKIIPNFNNLKKSFKKKYLKNILSRPIRVCGMVKNENEPGGGPFWVREHDGNVSLQIIESSQVDFDSKKQSKIFKKATHFNPVDIVCGIKNYKGEKFNLLDFVDHNSGFIVSKSKNGINYKAYELPGLWNGSMAKWITIFVEVPLFTFNPVKTVNDLLKPNHQE